MHDKYLENVDDATVKSAIETCVLNKLLFDLTEYEQAAAATYYLFKVNSVELTERNRIAEKDVNELIEKWKIQDKYYI